MSLRVAQCGIHSFHEVLGIDSNEIRVFWVLETEDEDAVQTAYQAVLYILPKGPSDTLKTIWDSGKVISSAQRDILCAPTAGLASTCRYSWQVTVWDQDDQPTDSTPNRFFTSYPRSDLLPPWSMNQTYMPHSSLIFRTWFEDEADRWKAVWIGNGEDKPLYLRKSFQLSRKPTYAVAFASGLGHFQLSANGRATSDHVLDPGWTNYHRRVQFVAYDLTDHLCSGQNVLGAHLGNGFYAGDQGDRFFWPCYEDNTYVRYGNELCFFAELHLFYEDGQHDVILSGPDWSVRKSATTLANIYASEDHDRRLFPLGWDAPGFDDSSWSSAKPLTGPRGKLSYQSQPPVVLHDILTPKTIKTPRPGIVCFDFGQNCSTMVKVVVQGDAGAEVIIRYGETPRDDGTILMPDPLFKLFETGVYSRFILAGTGEPETWQPDFSFTAARYIQLEGVSTEPGQGLPVVQTVLSQHVSSAARKLGSMKTNVEDVNQLITASHWSLSSNLFSYHTDCPQIEKFGWLEVTHLLAPATQYIRDMEALYTKILDDVLDAQEPDGLVPTMAPEMRYMCGPLHDTITWGCAICFLPDILVQYYDSTGVIARVYPAAVRYMHYMKKKERLGGLVEHGLGDWGRDIAWGNLQANIETAVYYKCLQCMADMARKLDFAGEGAHWQEEADRIYMIYNQHLLVPDSSDYPYAFYTSRDNPGKHDRQAVAQAVALQFGLVPAKHISDVHHAFLNDVADGRIRSGEIGLRFLFNTLNDLQRPDVVLKMARQEEHPSYMRFLRRGETTLLEFWQDDCRSKSHDLFCTIHEWFYAAVLGVKPVDKAYRTFSVRPPYDAEFKHVEGTVDCPYGLIRIVYDEKTDGVHCLQVTIPMSTVAIVSLPEQCVALSLTRNGKDVAIDVAKTKSLSLRNGSYIATMKPNSITRGKHR